MKMIQKCLLGYVFQPITMLNCCTTCILGTYGFGKMDDFLENDIADFARKVRDFATKVRMFIWSDICVLYDPISHEMHVVQQFNMVIC